MAVTSEPSPFTSLTASPMESHDPDDLPLELKVPLPTSSACSDRDEEKGKHIEEMARHSPSPPEEEIYQEGKEPMAISDIEKTMAVEDAEESPDPSCISLDELAQLVKLEAYQKHQALSARTTVERLILSCGLDRRLISTFSIAYGDMIDQYKTDDQAGFAGLYEACEQLKSSNKIVGRSSIDFGPDVEDTRSQSSSFGGKSTFRALPKGDQDNLLTFLTRIRTDPNFLSDRISQLSPTELTALTSSYHPAGIDFSILQNHSHGKSQFFSRDSQMMKLSRRMDNLQWFHKKDPFFALLYCVFDSTAAAGSREYNQRMQIWSTVCARTMVDGFGGSRPGSDELAIASLDAFANLQDWPLKPRIALYLMGILAKGAFLLESPTSISVNFKEPIETHNARTAIAEADFFEDALLDLFGLLAADGGRQAVPESALAFARAVLHHIDDPKIRLRAQQFIVIRWYFATFISSVTVYPEIRGIMMTQHIGETARRSILQKLVVKMQERVFDVILPWNENTLVNPRMRENIMDIFQSFGPSPMSQDHESRYHFLAEDDDATARFLMFTPLDIVGLVQVLCPDRSSIQSPADPGMTVSVSDRPSTAGSSTLVAGSSDIGSVLLAPPVKATATNSGTNEETATGPASENADPQDLAKSDLEMLAKTKETSSTDFDRQIRTACQKLRDVSAQTRDSNSSSNSGPWTFIYYSKDCLALSTDPIGFEAPDQAIERLSTTHQTNEGLDRQNNTSAYGVLKTAVIDLLSRDDNDLLSPERSATIQNSGAKVPLDFLGDLMESSIAKARSDLDFSTAHLWWRNFQTYRRYLDSHSIKSSRTLLNDVSKDLRDAVDNAVNIVTHCDVQCRSLSRQQRSNKITLAKMEDSRNALRIKMWYVSDVRHSATYEEALYVTRALRTMATSKRPKQPGSVSSWARQRLRGSSPHDRAETQTLEAITAPKDYGGVSKLADEQVELTSRWLTRKSIENFCKGEERVHRFCYEVQRSAGKIAGASLLENPVLWSSNLFKRERVLFDTQKSRSGAFNFPLTPSLTPPAPFDAGRIHPNTIGNSTSGLPPRDGFTMSNRSPASHLGGFWNVSQSLRQPTGLGLYGHRPALPPTPTSPPISWSNNSFGPGSPSFAATPPLPYDPISGTGYLYGKNGEEDSPAKNDFVGQVGRTLCSLLLSDLGYLLWNKGSETDLWVNDHIGDVERADRFTTSAEPPTNQDTGTFGACKSDDVTSNRDSTADKTAPANTFPTAVVSLPDHKPPDGQATSSFPYSQTYSSLLNKMSLTQDPYEKLLLLYELQDIVVRSLEVSQIARPMNSNHTHSSGRHERLRLRSKSVPRTKTTSLEEVMANCTERRTGTLRSQGLKAPAGFGDLEWGPLESSIPSADDIVNQLYSIFSDHRVRSTTLFRDLQYIATFVPAETLDRTAQGKAFWDAGLAALALKEDLCERMVGRANSITAYHMSPLNPAADKTLSTTTLRDAANLLLISAKEGSPVAARELGLFYLTHPELLPRVTMPFSKAKTVFKSIVSNDMRAGDKEKGALDPFTFAVVFHWMEIAANGGDKDAKDFLKGNGELSGGR